MMQPMGQLIGEKTDCFSQQQLMGGFALTFQVGLFIFGGDTVAIICMMEHPSLDNFQSIAL